MTPAEALETEDFESTDGAEEPEPFATPRSPKAASAAKPDFETGSVEVEDREIGNGAEAEFMLESTAVCPHCLEDIDKVQIVRMLRTKVNFVSSLPRRGQLLICPKCRIALAGALGGLI